MSLVPNNNTQTEGTKMLKKMVKKADSFMGKVARRAYFGCGPDSFITTTLDKVADAICILSLKIG